MANDLFSSAGMAPEIRNWYEKKLLNRAVPAFVFNKYAMKKSVPQNGGNNIQVRRMERITTSTTALTEGTPPTNTNGTFTQVTFTLAQYGQYARLSDVLIKQAQDDLMSEYSQNFGEAMGDALDQLLRDQLTGGTNVQYAGTAGSRGQLGSSSHYMTAAEIREAVRTLSRNNVPKHRNTGTYVAIFHPDTRFDFFNDSNVINAYQYAGPRTNDANPLFSGELFDWMGVRFDITTQAPIFQFHGFSKTNGSKAAVYATLVFGDEAFAAVDWDAFGMALIVKPLGTNGDDPLNQFASIGWKASFAGGIVDQTRLVRVEHTASIDV